jgi:hypothetical protein
VVAGGEKSDKFLNTNNPFANQAKQQILKNNGQMEEIVRLTLQAIQKVQIDLGTYMVELKTVNSQTRKGFADNVAKVFEE